MIDGPGLKVDGKLYKINEPPTHRPVRIYADGRFDISDKRKIDDVVLQVYTTCSTLATLCS